MYPSSSSSPSHKPAGHGGLTRYGSAPGSLLTTAVNSVLGADPTLVGHYISADSSPLTSVSTCKVSSSDDPQAPKAAASAAAPPLGSYAGLSSSSLLRQRSSPAGFFNHLTATENGFSVTRGNRNYTSQGGANGGHRVSRLKSQLSFTGQDSLSQISEVSENLVDGGSSSSDHQNAAHSFAGFGMDSWDNTNSIVFSAPSGKRAKNIDGDIYNCLNGLETQFSLPQTTLEMATVEKLLQIPEDSVPCKIRAKRGCATHPRSIAERNETFDAVRPDTNGRTTIRYSLINGSEKLDIKCYSRKKDSNKGSHTPSRSYFPDSSTGLEHESSYTRTSMERRTRISGKLKKLQELVPNMDKQTSYADMLDLAVQHIKGLQNEVQKLHKELESCTCGCKR